MRCTKCGTESTISRKFCAACGSPLSRSCPRCAENAPSSAFCEDCGSVLAGTRHLPLPVHLKLRQWPRFMLPRNSKIL